MFYQGKDEFLSLDISSYLIRLVPILVLLEQEVLQILYEF